MKILYGKDIMGIFFNKKQKPAPIKQNNDIELRPIKKYTTEERLRLFSNKELALKMTDQQLAFIEYKVKYFEDQKNNDYIK